MKAAAYARYSTDKQTNNSIAYQMTNIREYCNKNDIEIVAAYADEGETGTNTEDRIEFLQMIAAATRKEFQAVVVYDITRGSRDVGDWFNFRKTMKRLNIEVISVEDKLGDILNPNDFLVELLSVGIGQHSVLTSRQKSIEGVAVKAKEGAFLGGYAPIGYDIIDGKYVINERDAAIVHTIFDMYAKGQGYAAILEAIKGTKGKRGKPLGANSLNSILKNERYIGVYTWNKRKVKQMRKWAGGVPNPNCVRKEGQIPPIIDMDTWERVQRRMSENKRATNKAKREYLLTGLIECEQCGATFVGHTSTNQKGYEHRTYICGNKYRTRTCKAHNINADELETFVVMQLKEYLSNTDFEETAKVIAAKVNSASIDLSKEKKELADITKQLSNGVKAILSGMDFPELEEEMSVLRVRKSELEDIIARNTKNTSKLDVNRLVSFFKNSAANVDENIKEAVKQHITKIYAHADGSFTVNVGVHIEYCGGQI
ncbi:MAG: recombinase family protein [Clostridiales bacterium]|nr:recombinase family protein [Clostridiales bacterium]